jgi:hypothetical protein
MSKLQIEQALLQAEGDAFKAAFILAAGRCSSSEKDVGFEIKGVHCDPARRQLSLDTIVKLVRNMKAAGMNTLHLHLSDDQGLAVQLHEKVQVPKHGLIEPWSFEDQVFIGEECERNGIRIILELGMPGHSVPLRQLVQQIRDPQPTFKFEPSSKYGIKTPGLITVDNTGDDDLTYILKMFDGLCDRFGIKSGDLIHMGGDELGGLNTAARNLNLKDTVKHPYHGSWNYTRALVNRVCEWAKLRELRVIAWEDIFKRLFGYQASTLSENVDKDTPQKKAVQPDGTITKWEEGIPYPEGTKFEYRPMYTNEQLATFVYEMPDNLYMHEWQQQPTREWQRYIVPRNRTIVSRGYYLDMMKADGPGPLKMFDAKLESGVAGYIACVWGEWIGEENIDTVLYPMIYLLGSKFSQDGRRAVDILKTWLDATGETNYDDTWKMRAWVGFSDPGPGNDHHPMSTVMAPLRATPMTMDEVTYPAFSRFLVEFYVGMCTLAEHGTRLDPHLESRVISHLKDASRNIEFKSPNVWKKGEGGGLTNAKQALEEVARVMFRQHTEKDRKRRCEKIATMAKRIKDMKGKRSILYPMTVDLEPESQRLFQNGFKMILQGIVRFTKQF